MSINLPYRFNLILAFIILSCCSTPIAFAASTWLNTTGNSNWSTASNWSGGVPTTTQDVIINVGTTYPILSSGTGSCRNLTIANGASLTVTGAILQISGAIPVNGGTFNASGGNIVMNGTAAQTMGASLFQGNSVINLTISNSAGVTLNGTLNISGILLVSNGTFATNGFLTLLSTSVQTALIDGSGAGSVTGNVTMQRYLAAGHGYKLVSSPFTAATVGGFSSSVTLSATFPNFYNYVENTTTTGFKTDTIRTNALTPLQGYAANFGSGTTAKTISLSGIVNNGSVSISLSNNNKSYTQGFNLVGNPYPSPIDITLTAGLTATNVDNAVYYFDSDPSSQYAGAYSTYINGVSSDGIASSVIASMQGFFVHVTNGTFPVAGSVTIINSIRVANLTPYFHKSTLSVLGPSSRTMLRLSANFSDDAAAADPLVVYASDKASVAFNKELDAIKLMNANEQIPNLYIMGSDATKLAIQALQKFDSVATIHLGLQTPKDGEVTFNLRDLEQWPDGLPLYLTDAETGINQDLRQNPIYTIKLKEGAYESRFSLRCIPLKSPAKIAGKDDKYYVYTSDGRAFMHIELMNDLKGYLMISDIFGRRISSRPLNGNGDYELEGSMANGALYIASFVTSAGAYSRKFLQ